MFTEDQKIDMSEGASTATTWVGCTSPERRDSLMVIGKGKANIEKHTSRSSAVKKKAQDMISSGFATSTGDMNNHLPARCPLGLDQRGWIAVRSSWGHLAFLVHSETAFQS